MRDCTTEWKPLHAAYPCVYFAGANTADGFYPAYPAHIREGELSRLYIIKGGSGTGKSTMIRACAARGEELGAKVTLLLCSSDPSSADAVLLRGKNGRTVSVLDGTAPHTLEPEFPGAAGEIVDVGRYWDPSPLRARREEIMALSRAKKESYSLATRYLDAYRQMRRVGRHLMEKCMRREKMEAAAARLLQSFPHSAPGAEEIRYTHALSMTGAWHLDTFSANADHQIRVIDHYGSGEIFLDTLRRMARSQQYAAQIAPAPADGNITLEMFFPASNTAVQLSDAREEDGAGYVNMQRFIDRSALSGCRAKLRFAARCGEEMLRGALTALADARQSHFALEEIYRGAMDFSGCEKESARLCREIDAVLGE